MRRCGVDGAGGGGAVRDAKTLGNPPQIWHAGLAFGRVLHDLGRRDEAITTVQLGNQYLPYSSRWSAPRSQLP